MRCGDQGLAAVAAIVCCIHVCDTLTALAEVNPFTFHPVIQGAPCDDEELLVVVHSSVKVRSRWFFDYFKALL